MFIELGKKESYDPEDLSSFSPCPQCLLRASPCNPSKQNPPTTVSPSDNLKLFTMIKQDIDNRDNIKKLIRTFYGRESKIKSRRNGQRDV